MSDAGSTLRVVVVVPTRNRADLASTAIRSIVEQASDDVSVFVSDNSTSTDQAARLSEFCTSLGDRVQYGRPPEPLPMPPHWQWALHAALDSTGASHVVYLTDRMLFKPGELPALMDCARRFPDKVISYNHDTVLDQARPVRLRLEPWSGRLFDVRSRHLLTLSSHGVTHPSLPRMLNCIVPRQVLADVEAGFGSAFSSIAPDFCFAYRCLDTVETILYLDKSLLLQHGLSRSNGSSYARGVDSPDRADFTALLGKTRMNFAAPVPEFQTIRNAILHEYAFVKGESRTGNFPSIDPRGYLAAVVEDLSLFEDRAARSRMLGVLADNGWVGSPKRRYDAGIAAVKLMFLGWDALRGGQRLLSRLVPLGQQFDSTADAIAYANQHPRPPEAGVTHLEALLRLSGSVNEVIATATTQPSREAPARG